MTSGLPPCGGGQGFSCLGYCAFYSRLASWQTRFHVSASYLTLEVLKLQIHATSSALFYVLFLSLSFFFFLFLFDNVFLDVISAILENLLQPD